jgi:hypothetical protein
MKSKNKKIFNFVPTTRFCQLLSGTLKDKRLDRQIIWKPKNLNRIRHGWSLANVVNNEQDQIWLTSYECSEQWMHAILEWYFRRFWEAVNWCYFFTSNIFEQFCVLFILFFNLLCIYYSIFFSIALYSQFPDVLNWLRNFYKAFFMKFKITLYNFC